ncbi:MAG TPA: Uma2 family endonuclease [Methylomirabilota bacterium]|nr:Uma2 family endonuclease [Methylomirabilota bacterium]
MSEAVRTRRWTRGEYDRLVEHGIFAAGERIELLGGLLVVREPQGGRHAMGVRMVEEALRAAFGSGWDVRGQLPVALDAESEPEPDVSVVPGSFRDYPLEHPARAVLVVEIADSSLALDRGEKAGLYARARVPEYWIVNLVDRTLEVHRESAPDAGAPFGSRYREIVTLRPGETVVALAAPDTVIAVADLVP